MNPIKDYVFMKLYFILLMKSHLQSYPCPLIINYFWNFGFLLGITILLQIITGIFLALHYTSDINSAYFSIFFLIREIYYGWCLRYRQTLPGDTWLSTTSVCQKAFLLSLTAIQIPWVFTLGIAGLDGVGDGCQVSPKALISCSSIQNKRRWSQETVFVGQVLVVNRLTPRDRA